MELSPAIATFIGAFTGSLVSFLIAFNNKKSQTKREIVKKSWDMAKTDSMESFEIAKIRRREITLGSIESLKKRALSHKSTIYYNRNFIANFQCMDSSDNRELIVVYFGSNRATYSGVSVPVIPVLTVPL